MKGRGGLSFPFRGLWVGSLLAGMLFALGAPTPAQTPPASSPPSTEQPAPQPAGPAGPPVVAPELQAVKPIPIAQIADRSEDTGRILKEVSRRLGFDLDLIRIEAAITVHGQEISDRMTYTTEFLDGTPTLIELRDLEYFWGEMSWQNAAERKLLNQAAVQIQKDLELLDHTEAVWTVTLAEVGDQPTLIQVSERVRGTIQEIEKVQATSQQRLGQIVALQAQMARQDLISAELLETVSAAISHYRRSVLTPEVLPLWAPRSERLAEVGLERRARPAFLRDLNILARFLASRRFAFLFILCLALVTFIWAWISGRRRPPKDATPSFSNPAWLVRRPFSLAVLVGTTGLLFLTPKAPSVLPLIIGTLMILPLVRLFLPMSPPPFQPLITVLVLAHLTYEGIELLPVSPVLERELVSLWALSVIISGLWLTRPACAAPMRAAVKDGARLLLGMRLALAILSLALVANALGYFDLAVMTWQGTLYSLYLWVILYLLVQLAASVVHVSLKTQFAEASFIVRHHREALGRWCRRLFVTAAVLFWTSNILTRVTTSAHLNRQFQKFLHDPIVVGKARFTLGEIWLFVATLLAGVILTQVVCLLLRDEVLGRLGLRKGMPEAISTVTRYILYVTVCLFAFYASGAPMDKFTLLTGAFGVGIGFGLQNIVNNFVSGIILLFERPINPGDTVELAGNLLGKVKRIGVRSCTVRTLQGAEVIVPNSELVSNNVINWTLSDQHRRIEVPVGVAYGSDPRRVLALLEGAARSTPGVMTEPAPLALFMGFGDSALNFELRFWSPDQDASLSLRSATTVAVMEALAAEGIEIPFPQHDLHVKSIDPEAAKALAGADETK